MLRIYNTLTREIQPFRPIKKGVVSLYSCGPTVYDFPHIGNMRRYLTDDILYRALKKNGYKVKRIINITDVGHLTQDDFDAGEDKIIRAAKREGKSPLQIAQFYTSQFLQDAAKLNLAKPDRYAKASDHIAEMQNLVERLIKKGFAYEVEGTVYFSVNKVKDYGKFSGNTLDNLRERVRPELNKEAFKQKKSPADFVLWVKAQPGHLLQWPSPWGSGYPGWHVECAAMILTHFGPTIDIHTGGQDNIFPHHEDEIAEAKAATGKPLARYWMHTKHLLVNQQKMSKRNKTFITLKDLEKKGFNPLAFRFLVLGAHYASSLNFTWKAQAAAQEGWDRIYNFERSLRRSAVLLSKKDKIKERMPKVFAATIEALRKQFYEHINNDLATPEALAILSKLVNFGNTEMRKSNFSLIKQESLLELLLDFDEILVILPRDEAIPPLPEALEKKIITAINKRTVLKKNKKYAEADKVREKLAKIGITLKDSAEGTFFEKKKTNQTGFVKND